jgi:hypothetical protein
VNNRLKVAVLGMLLMATELCVSQSEATEIQPSIKETSTEWRDDEKNLVAVGELNHAYARLPFSREYDGVQDNCPVELSWKTGENLPVAWKGGVAGIFGDEIALVGGLWMPGRKNLAYAYQIKTGTYKVLPPPPFETAYTQGTFDGTNLFVIGGRSAGRKVARLDRVNGSDWRWTELPPLPESEGSGRWLAATGVVPGKWLFLVAGHPTGSPSEVRTQPAMPDWRLRLDRSGAEWERMAPYPGGHRALVTGAVARGKFYVFGGSQPDAEMRSRHVKLSKEFQLAAPYNGVPNYRDAYCYEPEENRWHSIRNLPLPMLSGAGVVLKERYILLMGSSDTRTFRVGKQKAMLLPFWTGYGDLVLCYDLEQDNYSRVGVMIYGVATCPWVSDGESVFGFGGEPGHGYNDNTESVLQIGTIQLKP